MLVQLENCLQLTAMNRAVIQSGIPLGFARAFVLPFGKC